MMASKKPFTLVLSGILALSMLSPAALAAEVQDNGSDDVPAYTQELQRKSDGNVHEKPNGNPDNGNHNGWDKEDVTAKPGDVMDDDMMVTPEEDVTATPGDVMDDDMMVTPEEEETDIPDEEIPGSNCPQEVFVREYHVTGDALAGFKDYTEKALGMDLSDFNCTMVKFNFNDDYWVLSAWNAGEDTWSATPISPEDHQPEQVSSIYLEYYRIWTPKIVRITIPVEDLSYFSYDLAGLRLNFAEFTVKEETPVPVKEMVTLTLMDGEEVYGEYTVEKGSVVDLSELEDPSRTGCTFLGWFAEGSDTPYDLTQPLSGDLILSSRFEVQKPTEPIEPTDPEGGGEVITGPSIDRDDKDEVTDEVVIDEEETPLDDQPVAETPAENENDQELVDESIPLTSAPEVLPVLDQQSQTEEATETVSLEETQLPLGELPQTGMVIQRNTAVPAVLTVAGLTLAAAGLYLLSRKEEQE